MSVDRAARAREFLDLHQPGAPLLMANAWDLGSARLLVAAGFKALATTSSGLAAGLGRLDYGISREDALAHAAGLCDGVDVRARSRYDRGAAGVAGCRRVARQRPDPCLDPGCP
jgi:2-methylisocitrate lyase-like PEP mutase family enzyme